MGRNRKGWIDANWPLSEAPGAKLNTVVVCSLLWSDKVIAVAPRVTEQPYSGRHCLAGEGARKGALNKCSS